MNTPNTITFQTTDNTWVMRITADRRIEVNEDVDVTYAAQKVLDAMQYLLRPKAEQEPKREWVGLTDEDKKQIAKEANYNWEMTTGEYAERIGRLTESKLKEKNTIIKNYPEKDKT